MKQLLTDCQVMLGELVKLIPAIALSALGGFANTLVGKPRGERYLISIALPEIGIAIFAGIVMHYLCQYLELSPTLSSATIALSGYSARVILELLKKMLLNKIKKLK